MTTVGPHAQATPLLHSSHGVLSNNRQRSRRKGSIGGGGVSHTFDWVREGWLASWLAEERVVEALLGESEQDADPAGTEAAANDGDGPQGVRNQANSLIRSLVRVYDASTSI